MTLRWATAFAAMAACASTQSQPIQEPDSSEFCRALVEVDKPGMEALLGPYMAKFSTRPGNERPRALESWLADRPCVEWAELQPGRLDTEPPVIVYWLGTDAGGRTIGVHELQNELQYESLGAASGALKPSNVERRETASAPPGAAATLSPAALNIYVDSNRVLLDGKEIAQADQFPAEPDWKIIPLFEALAKRDGPNTAEHLVKLRGSRDASARQLNSVLKTIHAAGYEEVSLCAVLAGKAEEKCSTLRFGASSPR